MHAIYLSHARLSFTISSLRLKFCIASSELLAEELLVDYMMSESQNLRDRPKGPLVIMDNFSSHFWRGERMT